MMIWINQSIIVQNFIFHVVQIQKMRQKYEYNFNKFILIETSKNEIEEIRKYYNT